MVLELKTKDPIQFYMKEQMIKTQNSQVPFYPGVMLSGEHYGFSIIQTVDERTKTISKYQTQCRIYGASLSQDKEYGSVLTIYEDGKYCPWKFTMEGKLIQPATFLTVSRKDLEYIQQRYPIAGISDLERINEYMLDSLHLGTQKVKNDQ